MKGSRSKTHWLRLVMLSLAYFVSAKLGLTLALVDHSVTLFWPSSGLALAALLLFGMRMWPGILLGALLTNFSVGLPIISAVGISIGSTFEAWLGMYLLQRYSRFDVRLAKVQDVLQLFFWGGLVSTLISAVNGAFWLAWPNGLIDWERFGQISMLWWMGDALGVFLFTSTMIAFFRYRPLIWTPAIRKSALWMFMLLILLCVLIFTDVGKLLFGHQPKLFLLMPMVIWAALAFNLRMVSAVLLIVLLSALYGMLAGAGRFPHNSLNDAVDVWLFVVVLTTMGIIVSIFNEQRKRIQKALIEKESLLSDTQRISHVGSWSIDLRTGDMVWTEETYRIHGVSPETFKPNRESFIKLVHADDRSAMQAWIKASVAEENPGEIEIRSIHPDGHLRILIAHGDLQHDEQNRVVRMLGTVQDITERKESESNYRALMDQAADAIFVADHYGQHYLDVNQAACEMLGYTREELLKLGMKDLLHPEDTKLTPVKFETMWSGKVAHSERRHRRKDGNYIWVELNARMLTDGRLQAVVRDITKRKISDEKLLLAAKVFEGSGEGIIIADAESRIISVNQAFTRVTGYTMEEVKGKNPRILSSGMHDVEFYRAMWSAINETGFWQGEIWDKDKTGRIYPKLTSISVIKNEQDAVTHYISTFADISERKEAEKNIQSLAYFDVLTGLPNRTLLHDRLGQLLAAGHRDKQKFALLFLDLDRFKYVNDSMGHGVGDELLKAVAKRLQEDMREGDTVARIGGDEFIVLLRESDADSAARVASKILSVLAVPFDIGELQIATHASIGISIFPENGDEADTLIKHADAAMYRVKEEGRNNFQFFTPEMNFHANQLFSMEKDLRLALERNEFLLYFQPQLNLKDGKICGAEALIRWQHPEKGFVSPADFIMVAEETGQILPIGEWVLRSACAQLAAWRKAGMAEFTMAVNLSIRQLRQPNLVQLVASILEENGLQPSDFELEITEGIMMEAQSAMTILSQLHELGVILSIDDFGTGYSSMSYLKKLPVNKLKIDQSFVRDITTDENDAAIVSSIISLGHQFSLQVIAEGVETLEQLDFLHLRGCDEIQGYYFSRPLPEKEFVQFIKENPNLI